MVECEFQQGKIYASCKRVLIDTWWNVNDCEQVKRMALENGFNRYMVECESFLGSACPFLFLVLIDTWWNVNAHHMLSAVPVFCFNRYMVECEFEF